MTETILKNFIIIDNPPETYDTHGRRVILPSAPKEEPISPDVLNDLQEMKHKGFSLDEAIHSLRDLNLYNERTAREVRNLFGEPNDI